MCWILVASLLRGQDATLPHSQLPATSAMEVGLQTARLLQGCLTHLQACLLPCAS